jgi:hypothetical protein
MRVIQKDWLLHLLLIWLLIFLPRREAEWRFCAVGTAARMADGGEPTEQDWSEAPNVRGESA